MTYNRNSKKQCSANPNMFSYSQLSCSKQRYWRTLKFHLKKNSRTWIRWERWQHRWGLHNGARRRRLQVHCWGQRRRQLCEPHCTMRLHQCRCDRTTSEMRGLSPKIISGDSRRSENAQTHTHKHAVPYMKFKLKLLQIKCHVLEFTQDKAQNVLQRIIRVFVKAFVSHDRHTLFALEESEPPRTTYTCESQ
jgi:hypothetical protein